MLTDKCPLLLDDKITSLKTEHDGLESRVGELDKDYQLYKVETAASQARTQALIEQMASALKEKNEADAEERKADAEERKLMWNLICSGKKYDMDLIVKLIGFMGAILLAILGLKAMVPGFLG